MTITIPAAIGDRVQFLNPKTGQKHTITVREIRIVIFPPTPAPWGKSTLTLIEFLGYTKKGNKTRWYPETWRVWPSRGFAEPDPSPSTWQQL